MTALPVRERIIQNIKAAVSGALTPIPVERNRLEDLHSNEPELIVLRTGDDSPFDMYAGEECRAFGLDVEGYVIRSDFDTAGADAAVLAANIEVAMMADPTAGGLARYVEIAPEPRPALLDVPEAVAAESFVRTFVVIYAYQTGNPFQVA